MRRLNKNNKKINNTIQSFATECGCACSSCQCNCGCAGEEAPSHLVKSTPSQMAKMDTVPHSGVKSYQKKQ